MQDGPKVVGHWWYCYLGWDGWIRLDGRHRKSRGRTCGVGAPASTCGRSGAGRVGSRPRRLEVVGWRATAVFGRRGSTGAMGDGPLPTGTSRRGDVAGKQRLATYYPPSSTKVEVILLLACLLACFAARYGC